jgi:mono/diheme cytochrome c family protein
MASIPKLTVYLPIVSFALFCVFTARSGVQAAEKPASSARAKHGETIFKAQCIGCHNKQVGDTSPFGPPNLHGILGANPVLTPQQTAETIKQGKGVMPAFGGKLNTSDINDVVAYLKTQ